MLPFFVLRRDIFDYMEPGDELVEAPFQKLIGERKLGVYTYDGFWACMDTFKEKQLLDDLYATGDAPWTRIPVPAVRLDDRRHVARRRHRLAGSRTDRPVS